MTRAIRSDAVANREKVLLAALRALKRDVTVPVADIAHEAGVGIGTLYRHFGDREGLLDALQVRSIGMVLALVEDIMSRDAPGIEAVREFLIRTVEHGSQLFLPYHGAPPTTNPKYAALQDRVAHCVQAMVGRGIADGTVRADLTGRDVIIFGSLIAVPLPAVDNWPEVAGRQIDLFLAAVRPAG